MSARSNGAIPRSARVIASWGCVAALLSACGGGGDSGPVSSTLDFPLASALSAYVQTAHQFNLAGALDGTSYTASLSYTPGAASSFEGRAAATATQTVILRANGVLAGQSTSTSYFSVSPYLSYGSIDQSDGTYTVFNQSGTFPATVRVGQSGSVGTSTDYVNSSKTQVTGTSTVTWSVEADTATTALFCLNTVISGGPGGTGAECYKVDAASNVLGLVVKVTVNGKTLTLS